MRQCLWSAFQLCAVINSVFSLFVFLFFFVAIAAFFFADHEEIAIAALNLCIVLGLFVGFFTSSIVCVRPQLWTRVGVMLVMFAGYTAAEVRRRRKKTPDPESERLNLLASGDHSES